MGKSGAPGVRRFGKTLWFGAVLAVAAWPSTAAAREERAGVPGKSTRAEGDYLFPGMLRPSVAVATGSPYVAIADVALGLGRHAAVGVIGGVTPRVAGVGLHPRFSLDLSSRWRAIARLPVLYYPETNDAEQWLLTRPSLIVEHSLSPDGVRLYAGGGVLWAGCLDELLGDGDHTPDNGWHTHDTPVDDAGPMEVLFWTANLGGSVPLGDRIDGFVDVATVMQGKGFAGTNWTDFGGPPVIVVLGAALRL